MLEQIVSFLENNKSWIMLIPTILFFAIIVTWTIRGLMKGFRKGIIQFTLMIVALILSIIVFVILTANGGKLLYQMFGPNLDAALGVNMPDDFNAIFGTNITASEVNLVDSLSTYVFKLIVDSFDGIENVPIEYYQLANVIGEWGLRLVVFLVCLLVYLVFKILLWLIVYLPFFREGKYKKKCLARGKKYSKHRLLGSLVGAVRGAIIATLSVSVLATSIYILTAGREAQDSKFTDSTLSDIYDIDNYVREFGDSGILKLFNDVNINDVPFYMFFANSILQAKYDYNGEVVYATEEIMAFTGLAQDMLDLFNVYGGEAIANDFLKGNNSDEVLDTIADLFESETKIEYAGELRTFEEALLYLIDSYEGSVVVNNLLKVTIGTVVVNADTLLVSMGLEEDDPLIDAVSNIFIEDKNNPDYISPADLVTFGDCKLLLHGVIDSVNEIFDTLDYIEVNEDKETSSYKVGLLNVSLNIVSPISESLNQLSVFTNNEEDKFVDGELIVKNKKDKINRVLDRSVDAVFEYLNQKLETNSENPFKGTKVNWLDDFKAIFETSDDILVLSSSVEKELLGEANNDLLKAINIILKEDYDNVEEIDKTYDDLTTKISNFDIVNTLLESEFMYEIVYDTTVNSLVSGINQTEVTDLKLPRDIKWGNVDGKDGEFKVLSKSLKTLVRNGILDEFIETEEELPLVKINNILEILDKPINADDAENNESVLEYIFKSKFLHYTTSLVLDNIDTNEISILVPQEEYEVIDNINIIKKESIVALIKPATTLTQKFIDKGIEDFEQIGDDLNLVLDILAEDDVKNEVLSSNILVATASSLVVNTVEKNPEVADMVVIPDHLKYTDDEEYNQEIIKNWIGNDGEFSKILNAVTLENEENEKILDIQKIIDNDPNYYVSLTKISRPNFDTLTASDILYYSMTNVIKTLPEQDNLKIIVPLSVYDENTNNEAITRDELYNTLEAASFVLYVNENENELSYNLDGVIADRDVVLKSDILYATLINTIYNIANDSENDQFIYIPKLYTNNVSYDDENNPNYIFGHDFEESEWKTNHELESILNSISILEINLNDLVEGTIDQDDLTNKILILRDKNEEEKRYNIEIIYESKVLALTMTNLIIKNKDLNGLVYVPVNALENENDDQYIKEVEWYQLICGLEDSLGINDDDSVLTQLENINDNVKNIFTGEETEYNNKRDILLKSNILEYTLVKNIYTNLGDDGNMPVIIPDCLESNDYADWLTVKTEEGTDLANRVTIRERKELSNIMDVFYVTGIGEIYGEEGFEAKVEEKVSVYSLVVVKEDYNNTQGFEDIVSEKTHKQEVLAQSVVLKATTINTILQTNAVNIPEEYNEGNILKLEDGKYSANTESAIKANYNKIELFASEIVDIFAALNELELDVNKEEPNTINIEANIVLALNDNSKIATKTNSTKIEVINESKVLGLTLATKVSESISDVNIKDLSDNDNAVSVVGNDIYITLSEWKRMIAALGENGLELSKDSELADQLSDAISLVNNVLGTKMNNPYADEEYVSKVDTIFASYILEETLKVKIVDNLALEDGQENNTIIPQDTNWYLERNEDGTISSIASGNRSEMTTMLSVFKMLGLGVETEETNYQTFISENLQAANILVLKNDTLEEKEFKTSLQKEMLNSFVLHATMINNVYDIEALSKPQTLIQKGKLTNESNLLESDWYNNEELKNLFSISDKLQLDGEGSTIHFDIDQIFSNLVTSETNKNPVTDLAQSNIVYLTISDKLLEQVVNKNNSLALYLAYIENETIDYNLYNDLVVTTTELQAIFDNLDSLGINEITNTNLEIKVPNEPNANMFTSYTLRATISQKIISQTIDQTSDSELNTTYLSYVGQKSEITNDISTYSIITEDYKASELKYNVFSKEELANFLADIKVVMGEESDPSQFTISVSFNDIDELIDYSDKLTKISSNIAYSIISDAIIVSEVLDGPHSSYFAEVKAYGAYHIKNTEKEYVDDHDYVLKEPLLEALEEIKNINN